MERSQSIQPILKKVAKAVNSISSKLAIYKHDTGFLSESDIIAHQTFKNELNKFFPKDQVYSEEDSETEFFRENISEYSWIIDPICGTTNYMYGIPLYTHAMSLFRENQIIAAGVYDPSRQEMFFSDGKNFFINEKKYSLNKNIALSEALISYNTNQSNFDNKDLSLISILKKISPPISRRIHILESANLELAYVASGRIDAYYNPTDKPWDIAAAKLFISSANGAYKIFNNPEGDILNQSGILAANSKNLLDEISNCINK